MGIVSRLAVSVLWLSDLSPDVSTSFKQLQAEKRAADTVLRELSSVQSIQEVDALRDFLQNNNLKSEVCLTL